MIEKDTPLLAQLVREPDNEYDEYAIKVVVGGNHVIDQQTGGPQKREDAQIEKIRQVVREEVYLQLVNAWPKTSGPVKGLTVPKQDYKQVVPNERK